MSRIDKALEKAGLVPESDKKTSGAADEEELISAWDLDLSKDPEPAEDVLRSRAERNGTDVATRQAEPETYVDDTGIHARTDSTPYAGQSETTAWVTEASPLGEDNGPQRTSSSELTRSRTFPVCRSPSTGASRTSSSPCRVWKRSRSNSFAGWPRCSTQCRATTS